MDAEPPRLLLIDDDVAATRTLAKMLREDGYVVETAADGAAAIARLARGERPDAIIVDFRLPHADGLAVASFARARFPNVPVIVVTGWAEVVAKSDVVLDPPPHVMGKPVSYEELRALLGKLTRRHSGDAGPA